MGASPARATTKTFIQLWQLEGHRPVTTERTYLDYRPQDFLLYLGSLGIVGVVGWLALAGYGHAQIALSAGLAYMAITFVLKRGAAFDLATFPLIVRGIVSYPGRVLR